MRRLIDADKLFDAMEETEWYNNADRDEIAERFRNMEYVYKTFRQVH